MQPTLTNVNSLIQVTVNLHKRKMAADTNTLSKFAKSGIAKTKDVLLGIQKLVYMVNIASIRKRACLSMKQIKVNSNIILMNFLKVTKRLKMQQINLKIKGFGIKTQARNNGIGKT